jgi:hypothetical protein
LQQYIEFYESQTSDEVFNSFKQDYQYRLSSVEDVLETAKKMEDPGFEKEMNDLLGGYIKGDENMDPILK